MKIWESADPAVSLHNLALSPDGKTLAMTLSKEAWAQPHLGRIRIGIDKNTYTDLASSVSEGMFTWTRDGSAILFAEVSSDEGRMMRVAANGKLKPEFTGLVLSQACACGHTVDLNADGSRIVFSDATREGNVLYVLENVSTLLKSPR
jgi:Tol biopolymer transport system component